MQIGKEADGIIEQTDKRKEGWITIQCRVDSFIKFVVDR